MPDRTKRPRRPTTFAGWKAAKDLTDEQIATLLRGQGVEVKRAMVSAIIRGDRNAGNQLALALRDLTGLPIETFLLATARAA